MNVGTDFYPLTEELGGMTEVAMWEARRLFIYTGTAQGYYEFGVFKGYNLWRAWQAGRQFSNDIEYLGFDSFEGLPPNNYTDPAWAEGSYAASLGEVSQHLANRGVTGFALYKGWFSEEWFSSLPDAFPAAGVVVIDCDLYESTVPVLEFIRPMLVEGTVILFDDWDVPDEGEKRAWNEFRVIHPEIKTRGETDFGRMGYRVVIA